MRWWMTVAAAGIVGLATWLYRLMEREHRAPEREYEASRPATETA
jgi:hypothetical protein